MAASSTASSTRASSPRAATATSRSTAAGALTGPPMRMGASRPQADLRGLVPGRRAWPLATVVHLSGVDGARRPGRLMAVPQREPDDPVRILDDEEAHAFFD